MRHQRQVKVGRIFQGPPQQPGILDRHAVIADRHDPGLFHQAHLGQFAACKALGYRPHRQHPDQGFIFGLVHNIFGDRGIIVDRIGIGHAGHRCDPAGRGRH